MSEWTSDRVRSTFIDFFVKKCGHSYVESSPVIPHNDPTLLFANAGMNQFKSVFLGQVDPSSYLYGMKRATNSQKCMRAGGKHNDLEDVGRDTYHHTFFEMMGNWSFGDYFKKEAIDWAWELLIDVYKLDKSRLYATYFGGKEELGLPPDDEAKEYWLKYLPSDKVLPFGMKDNFWEMGDVGPCGPCSEIHYDLIGNRNASDLVNMDAPSVIEIWNLVFIQFNRETDRTLKQLPAKHVDTGLGLERLTSILESVDSNYDTDFFIPIFQKISEVTSSPPYTGKMSRDEEGERDMAYRVVADHVRTLTFAIADGAVPSNDGRGYVIRRILRRAVRYGRQKLQAPTNFICKIIPTCVELMKAAYPEVEESMSLICDIVEDEERLFTRTLGKGEALFGKVADEVAASSCSTIPGNAAFKLYDTYGFPVDLTQIMAEEKGMSIDMDGYHGAMDAARERSRRAKKVAGGNIALQAEQTSYLNDHNMAPTDDSPKYVWEDIDSTVTAIFDGKEFLDSKGSEEAVNFLGVILRDSSFYAESGGQVGDCGYILRDSPEMRFKVVNTQVFAGYVLHIGTLEEGSLSVGDTLTLSVDYEMRKRIAANHTCTHLLNLALRMVVGDVVDQKGSLVAPDKLRFDFSHNGPVKAAKLKEVEDIVRKWIHDDVVVNSQVVPLAKSRRISSLRAVFGETYPDPVRVICVGQNVSTILESPEDETWMSYSVELCGGTHLSRMSQAQELAIISEEAIAKGIRRIVAVTRNVAKDAVRRANELRDEIVRAEKLKIEDMHDCVTRLLPLVKDSMMSSVEKESLSKKLNGLSAKIRSYWNDNKKKLLSWAATICEEQNLNFVVKHLEANGDGKTLAAIAEVIKKSGSAIPVLFLSRGSGKVSAYCFVPTALHEKSIDAKSWLSHVIGAIDGRCGGNKNIAQGSGKNLAGVDAALEKAKEFISVLSTS